MSNFKEMELQRWESFFRDRGISESLIPQYIEYARGLLNQNLPVIFEVEHLAKLIGVCDLELNKMISNPSFFYRTFTIPKRRGGKRTISSPYPSLLMCQKWIYENILKCVEPYFCAHAYRDKKSIITNSELHLNKQAILKIDLEDFFHSIPINWVINFFSKLGYSNNVSYSLASICCLDDCLPQGASSSPALTNILLRNLDKRLYKLSKAYKLTYTRYADDLTFSGDYIPHKLIEIVTQIVKDFGLKVNKNKTSLIIGEKQKIVTGLSVSGELLTLPRKTRRTIKKEIHYIKKYGLVSHISKLKIKNSNYVQSLEGKLRFWLQVEPENKFARDSLNFILNEL